MSKLCVESYPSSLYRFEKSCFWPFVLTFGCKKGGPFSCLMYAVAPLNVPGGWWRAAPLSAMDELAALISSPPLPQLPSSPIHASAERPERSAAANGRDACHLAPPPPPSSFDPLLILPLQIHTRLAATMTTATMAMATTAVTRDEMQAQAQVQAQPPRAQEPFIFIL